MAYVRITTNAYLAVNEDKMIEIKACNKEKATEIAKDYIDEPFIVCKIPGMIGYVDEKWETI